MREFAGKTAFVTGGAAGIGLALGRAFAQSGMKVMLADIETDALQAAVKGLQEISPDIRGTICDVADAASVERAAQAAFDAFGNVHVVCNNAGVAAGGGIDHISLDNWRWVIDVNVMGVLHGIKSFLPHIRAHGEGGHIVNTASMAGMEGGLGFSPYAASKFAVRVLAEGLRQEVKPYNIRTTVISPGAVATELPNSVTEPDMAEGIHKYYDEFAIPAESFAQAVSFAMSQPDEVDVNEILFRPTRQML